MRRLVQPSTLIALVALMVALSGTSIAEPVAREAASLSGDVARALKLAKAADKRSRRALTRSGRRGPRGTQGSQGAQGAQGLQGGQGAAGATGEPGPFVDDLPSGKTIRGHYYILGTATAVSQFAGDTISWGNRLPSAPTFHVINPGAAVPSGCSGTEDNPGADPGHLCVFELTGRQSNQVGVTIDTPNRIGAGVNITSVAAGAFFNVGNWAVTAP